MNPVKKGTGITGHMKYLGSDRVFPKDCCATALVWIMVVIPSLFVLSIV